MGGHQSNYQAQSIGDLLNTLSLMRLDIDTIQSLSLERPEPYQGHLIWEMARIVLYLLSANPEMIFAASKNPGSDVILNESMVDGVLNDLHPDVTLTELDKNSLRKNLYIAIEYCNSQGDKINNTVRKEFGFFGLHPSVVHRYSEMLLAIDGILPILNQLKLSTYHLITRPGYQIQAQPQSEPQINPSVNLLERNIFLHHINKNFYARHVDMIRLSSANLYFKELVVAHSAREMVNQLRFMMAPLPHGKKAQAEMNNVIIETGLQALFDSARVFPLQYVHYDLVNLFSTSSGLLARVIQLNNSIEQLSESPHDQFIKISAMVSNLSRIHKKEDKRAQLINLMSAPILSDIRMSALWDSLPIDNPTDVLSKFFEIAKRKEFEKKAIRLFLYLLRKYGSTVKFQELNVYAREVLQLLYQKFNTPSSYIIDLDLELFFSTYAMLTNNDQIEADIHDVFNVHYMRRNENIMYFNKYFLGGVLAKKGSEKQIPIILRSINRRMMQVPELATRSLVDDLLPVYSLHELHGALSEIARGASSTSRRVLVEFLIYQKLLHTFYLESINDYLGFVNLNRIADIEYYTALVDMICRYTDETAHAFMNCLSAFMTAHGLTDEELSDVIDLVRPYPLIFERVIQEDFTAYPIEIQNALFLNFINRTRTRSHNLFDEQVYYSYSLPKLRIANPAISIETLLDQFDGFVNSLCSNAAYNQSNKYFLLAKKCVKEIKDARRASILKRVKCMMSGGLTPDECDQLKTLLFSEVHRDKQFALHYLSKHYGFHALLSSDLSSIFPQMYHNINMLDDLLSIHLMIDFKPGFNEEVIGSILNYLAMPLMTVEVACRLLSILENYLSEVDVELTAEVIGQIRAVIMSHPHLVSNPNVFVALRKLSGAPLDESSQLLWLIQLSNENLQSYALALVPYFENPRARSLFLIALTRENVPAKRIPAIATFAAQAEGGAKARFLAKIHSEFSECNELPKGRARHLITKSILELFITTPLASYQVSKSFLEAMQATGFKIIDMFDANISFYKKGMPDETIRVMDDFECEPMWCVFVNEQFSTQSQLIRVTDVTLPRQLLAIVACVMDEDAAPVEQRVRVAARLLRYFSFQTAHDCQSAYESIYRRFNLFFLNTNEGVHQAWFTAINDHLNTAIENAAANHLSSLLTKGMTTDTPMLQAPNLFRRLAQ